MIKYSVKKPYTVFVGIMLVLVLGVVSFLDLQTDLLPTIELPYVIVQTVYPGATPERVETSVTAPIEQAVSTVNGLNNVSSVSAENMSLVILEFSESINMDSAMLDLSANIDMVSGYFEDTVQPPILLRINPDSLPIQTLTVNYDGMDIKELTTYVEEELVPYLKRVGGVASVDVSGTVSDRVEIRLNQLKIDGITADILKSIDSALYETQMDLEEAQDEINAGLNEIDDAQQETFDTLASTSAEIDSGIAQLQALASEKTSLESLAEIKDGQKQALDGKLQLLQTIELLNSFETNPMFQPIPPATEPLTVQEIVDILAPSGVPPLPSEPLFSFYAALAGLLQTDPAMGALTPAMIATSMQPALTELNAALTQLGVSASLVTTTDITTVQNEVNALESEIANLKQDIAATDLVVSQLNGTIAELESAYTEIESGKLSATSELTVTETELRTAQDEIAAGLDEFERARDEALKSANIDGLVTQEALSGILTAQNFSFPAGYVSDGNTQLTVKVGEQFASLDEVKNLLLLDMGLDGVEPIHLSDVADVVITDDSEDSYVRVNGNSGLIISIQKSSIASTSEVSNDVNLAIADAMAADDKLHIDMLMDQGIYIDLVIDSVMSNLIYGGLIALVVLLFFLKDLRPTFIIGLSIPLSLLISIVLMYFSDVTLNIISLSGLALGVGMLVDNSIVAIENIYRLRKEGMSRTRAAVAGASQVGGAIFASTLTTVCVFLPIVFVDGMSRQLFEDMGLTIAYSLFSSLLVAMTVVPAMASSMLRSEVQKEHKLFDAFVNAYEKVLDFNLRYKFIVIILATAMLAGTLLSLLNMPLELFPSMSSTQMQMTLTMEDETERDELIASAEEIAAAVATIEGVETVSVQYDGGTSTGMMSFMSGGADSVTFFIVIDEESGITGPDISPQIRQLTPEYEDYLSITENNMDMSALSGEGITINIKGNDLDVLQSTATGIKNTLSDIEGIEEITDGSEQQEDELRIIVDASGAAKYSQTIAQVYTTVSEALTEETSSTIMTFGQDDMTAIIIPSEVATVDTLGDIVVATEMITTEDEDGEEKEQERDVLLSEIATIENAKTPESISRDAQSRTQSVAVTIAEGYNVSLVARDVDTALASFEIPDGYSVEVAGENETIVQTMSDLLLMLLLAVVFIYLIMVAQFQSLLSPFIVIFTIPLAFTGGLLALILTGQALSVTSMVGFLVLAGVVVNNGIVFVDYVNQLREDGMEKRAALLKTGRDRIRPIFMTALTTILAMSTMALGVGLGAEMSQGVAIVTIGGLSYSTVLTLLLIPALYDIFSRRKIKKIDVDEVQPDPQ